MLLFLLLPQLSIAFGGSKYDGMSPPEIVYARVENILLSTRDEYQKQKGFHVHASLHRLEVVDVNEESQQVNVSVTFTYKYRNPHINWNPKKDARLTINEIYMDTVKHRPPRIYDCSGWRFEYESAVPWKRSKFNSMPYDSHNCTFCLSIDAIDRFDIKIDDGIATVGPKDWFVSNQITSASSAEFNDTIFPTGQKKRELNRRKVTITYKITRNVDYYYWIHYQRKILIALIIVIVVLIARFIIKKYLAYWKEEKKRELDLERQLWVVKEE